MAATERKYQSEKTFNIIGMITEKTVTSFDLFLLASNIIIGSLTNIDFSPGYWMLLFNTILSGVGYIILTFSLAEMTSALPYSGGIYGIVRAFLHPFVGFYSCIFELMINMFYLALSVHSFSLIGVHAGDASYNENILVSDLLVYIAVLIVCLLGGKVFWWTNALLGFTCLGLIMIYILGAIPTADFSSWKHTREPFTVREVIEALPRPSLTYLGIQYLPLQSKFTKDPKNDVPFVMIVTVAIVFALSMSLITVAFAQYPGYDELAAEEHPLTFGYSKVFGLSLSHAHYVDIPGMFANCFTFMYCFGKQASSMASSGLLPKLLTRKLPMFETPYIALIFVTTICYLLNIFLYYYEEELWRRYAFICALSTYIVFICFFVAYIEFARNYTSLQRSVRSPFGVGGAVVGVLIFLLCGISVVGFQSEGYVELVFLVLVSLMVIGVYVWVLGAQKFSEEEKNELFKAYLITANRATKDRIHKRNRKNQKSVSDPRAGSAVQRTITGDGTAFENDREELNSHLSDSGKSDDNNEFAVSPVVSGEKSISSSVRLLSRLLPASKYAKIDPDSNESRTGTASQSNSKIEIKNIKQQIE